MSTPCLKILSSLLLVSLVYILVASSFFTSPRLVQQHLNLQPHFELCPSNYTNHCPCEDPTRQKRFPKAKWFRKERHCPQTSQRLRCLVPIPPGYRTPFPWPKSKDTAWFSNVPFPKLVEYKKSQNWVRLEGERFVFPGGGTSFPEGANAYVDALNRLLPLPLESGNVRTVLDICYIRNGLYLREIDRILRPGGFWVLSGPPINWRVNYKAWQTEPQLLEKEQSILEDLAMQLCWEKVAEREHIAVWQKPIDHISCIQKLKTWRFPKFCNSSDPDAGWYTKMTACIFPLPDVKDVYEISGGVLQKWPMRLNTVPPRVRNANDDGFTLKTYIEDNRTWKRRVSNYGVMLKCLSSGKYRNVMDTNAGFGGFAAAMVKYPVWVMNVVPFDAKSNNLGIIYERGLIGTYMDWCEPFSTYPRTYDLIHASGLFSMYMVKCDITDILVEIHRILRPKGVVIIRDHRDVILKVKEISDKIRWKGMLVAGDEDGPFHPEMIMVASFGASLMDYDILTMSIAPSDEHEAQVQFALERGLPAMLGVLSTHRLTFPSRSFDMAHCSRCLVPWTAYDGLYLREIDRILRPGGFWVLSGPPINWRVNYKAWQTEPQLLEKEQSILEDLAMQLCWEKVAEREHIAVWQKPIDHISCMQKLKTWRSPKFCNSSDPDAGWYTKMTACIFPLPDVKDVYEISSGVLQKWPMRLNTVPPRIRNENDDGFTLKTYIEDNRTWKRRVSNYGVMLKSLSSGKYRNVMDMNAGFGGFAAAMVKYPVWVMNVVPFDAKSNNLGIIYERGLIGTYMDWCEPFSTYPRTYDLIHASGLFSMYMDKCDITDILVEIHRILRPEGVVIIRDHRDVILKVKEISDKIRWKGMLVAGDEDGPFHPEMIMVINNTD